MHIHLLDLCQKSKHGIVGKEILVLKNIAKPCNHMILSILVFNVSALIVSSFIVQNPSIVFDITKFISLILQVPFEFSIVNASN